MILIALKLMLLYLIEIGMRLRRCVKGWFRRFMRFFWAKGPSGEPVLRQVEEESTKYRAACEDLEKKCASVERQMKEVDAKINTYRVLKRGWTRLLTGMDYSIRSSMNTKQMVEKSETFLMSAKRMIVLDQRDFDGSRKALERYEAAMNDWMDLLEESGLVQKFPTDDMLCLSRVNVPLYHIALLREQFFFLEKLLDPKTKRFACGSPRTWEEHLAMCKEEYQT